MSKVCFDESSFLEGVTNIFDILGFLRRKTSYRDRLKRLHLDVEPCQLDNLAQGFTKFNEAANELNQKLVKSAN